MEFAVIGARASLKEMPFNALDKMLVLKKTHIGNGENELGWESWDGRKDAMDCDAHKKTQIKKSGSTGQTSCRKSEFKNNWPLVASA